MSALGRLVGAWSRQWSPARERAQQTGVLVDPTRWMASASVLLASGRRILAEWDARSATR